MNRRTLLTSAAATLAAPALLAVPTRAPAADAAERRLATIELRTGGRLGVAVSDTGTGHTLAYRAHERFPMCSTFKALAVAAVLRRVESREEQLDRRIPYTQADLLAYAPVTREHVHEGGMTVEALCAAAIEYSDNTAANLLLASLGGPEGVTRFARALGDRVTRLDRTETSLNTAIPGDPRDTTTPAAMAADLRDVLIGNALLRPAQLRLQGWMDACKTSAARLRAGLPRGWAVGDKTGTGENGTANDIGIVRPVGRKPLLVAVYLTGATAIDGDRRDAAIADVGRVIGEVFR
ncbi:MAG TPA: class A beta-lactamase [Candidatus Sulfotelmatobacter sp.]|nr:class A beta-lactamase [Candidatus Sulfotelmatobacter sp.]